VHGWLVSDYGGTNPVLAYLLGRRLFLTRRAFLLISENGTRLLVSRVDAVPELRHLPGCAVETYTSWQELHEWLATHVARLGVVAMEYSPHGALPAMSRVDGGTLDLVRDLGVKVRSSADLFQLTVGSWSEHNLSSHRSAMSHAAQIMNLAFAFAGERLRGGEVCSESDVQAFILGEFEQRGLTSQDPPIVAANAHSGDPHYEPQSSGSARLAAGDWLLIDLFCREPSEEGVFADITWVGFLGNRVPKEHQRVIEVVAGARDEVVRVLRERVDEARPVLGYELDEVARRHIADAGFADRFVHRTGHSLGADGSLHGLTANLDDLETHDTRPIIAGVGFTVEPGIYLPAFGVRCEINVYMGADGPEITSPVQTAPVLVPVA
jgi:Xaa-Pro aminopeptidase